MVRRYVRFMFAPDTGAEGGTTTSVESGISDVDSTDYKALSEKLKSDYEKLKRSFDTTASELAERKKSDKAKMSEDEKREAELEEERQHWREVEKEMNTIKIESVFAKQGFEEKDYSDLAKKLAEFGGEAAQELANLFVEFVKKANKTAVASAKNGMIKDSSITPQASTAPREEHTYAQMATDTNSPSNKSNEIKDFYRKR